MASLPATVPSSSPPRPPRQTASRCIAFILSLPLSRALQGSLTSISRPHASLSFQGHCNLASLPCPNGLPTASPHQAPGPYMAVLSLVLTSEPLPLLPSTETLITFFYFVTAYSCGAFVKVCLTHNALTGRLALPLPSRAPSHGASVANFTCFLFGSSPTYSGGVSLGRLVFLGDTRV